MANKAGKKSKKLLQTTLGKATCHNEKDVDLSHVQKPINTSIFGLRQVLSLFQTATKEVQNYITYECDIMYECRTCRTIFRSLANFILHKRDYCRERFNHLDLLNNNDEENLCSDNTPNIINAEPVSISAIEEEASAASTKKSLLPVIEKLIEKRQISELAQEVLTQDLSSQVTVDDSDKSETKSRNDVLLEEIATNNAAVFQTVLRNLPKRDPKKPEFMKSEVMEIHGILDSDEVVLGPDGKICTFETNKRKKNANIPKSDLVCPECNLNFSTKKTLTYHIKYKHNNTRLVFVCPDCKDTFANAWCVYRHLFKVHRRTSAQIKRMRDQIHNSCVRKDQEPVKKKDKKNEEKVEKTDEENQWLSNIEGDNDFQMCGGCGKRFERKAALHSHAQMCTKRIAVCNTIKENNAKKKGEESSKDLKTKSTKAEKTEVLKGSSKRKPYLLRTYKFLETKNKSPIKDKEKESPNTECNDCDVNANCEIIETNDENTKDVVAEVIQRTRRSLSSSEDLLSPSNKDFVSSPSVEKIDTEKMLNIIGITANYESAKDESTQNLKPPIDCDKDCNLEQNNVANVSSSDHSKDMDNSNSTQDLPKESSRSHTVSDFDLFCQSVANSLQFEDSVEETPKELHSSPEKTTKTIPLILRRRKTSSKYDKGNIIEENSGTLLHDDLPEKETGLDKNNSPKNTEVAQLNESDESDNLKSGSSFKISVKNLKDLIDVSPHGHIKDSKGVEIILDNSNSTALPYNEISDTLKANVSPERLCGKFPKKRKRTSSFDFTQCNKLSKPSKGVQFANKQDINFISKASPFMDQNKLLCIPCGTTYPTLSKLLWHMSAHFSWFRFQCSRCSFISFNKMDCADHALKTHHIKKSTIVSVVLPIPNWKTVLMSHDFCMLNNESDPSGKHTDEILSGNSEEVFIEPVDEDVKSNDGDESEWCNTLFVESKNIDSEPENDPLESDITLGCANIKQESIDVIDNTEESFQIEIPAEIYTLDISDIIEEVKYEEKETNRNNYDANELLEIDDFMDELKIKEEAVDAESHEKAFIETEVKNVECLKKNSSQTVVNVRPTRNRIRSIKTSQDDFVYDLNKVIKLNDTSISKQSSLQKLKKSASIKLAKDSLSSHSKSASQQMRVYSKRK